MRFDFDLFLRALGLAVVLEGLCWALFPRGMRRALRELLAQPEGRLRAVGLTAVAVGLLLTSLAR
ncbi:DUF2065 domain-containing protein [Desulfovibrio legallii]|uniref:DUF2065 domain-containing protein n=1 Tax=Desulfovibrio legallii TaxID=571438 RepID=A0A6H3FC06_9BACT|nr:DUF2065 domain-containing protein [Desulfovibrio legallii]RHH19713.1 DUF2065 domain-containing protein [Desulfovibrio sp. AM18-2]TBH81641.1 DUF2065 domain-containing protein [Desulfovibrio legallii]